MHAWDLQWQDELAVKRRVLFHGEWVDHLKTLGYKVIAEAVDCTLEEARLRNENRGDNISN